MRGRGARLRLGFDSVWTSEHLVVPPDLFDPFGQLFDSLTTLTYVAAVTERVGLGWLAEELALVGAEFARRAAVMDRHLDVLRHLLRSDPASSSSAAPSGFDGVLFAPAVVSPLPVLVGGHAAPALRRAARAGDGWHGCWLEPEEVPPYIAQTRDRSRRPDFRISLRTEFGVLDAAGPDDPARGLIASPSTIVDKLRRYEAAGVDELVIDFVDQNHGRVPDLPDMLEQLHRFRALVTAAFG